MADVFTWPVQIESGMEGQFNSRVTAVQFGDGYKQVSGDGINIESQSWPVTISGVNENVKPVLDFMRTHTTRAFFWTPPFGERALWRVDPDSIRASPKSSRTMIVSATFEQAFAP